LTVGLRKKGNQNKEDSHKKTDKEDIAVVVTDPPAFRSESEMDFLVILSPGQVCGEIARNKQSGEVDV